MAHLGTRVQQTVIEVNVQHQRAVLHLLACDAYRLLVILLLDEAQELAAARHVTTLADIDKGNLGREPERREAGKREQGVVRRALRVFAFDANGFLFDSLDMAVCRAAAAAEDIHQSLL